MKQRFLLALYLVGILGLLNWSGCSKKEEASHSPAGSQSENKIHYYTCSMHPQVHSDHPGNCPICGMKLVPVYKEGSSSQLAMPSAESTGESLPANSQPTQSSPNSEAPQSSKKILYYVDPMHPWYKSDQPGKAPDCGMDLVPVYEEGTTGSTQGLFPSGTVQLSLEKQQLIGVKTEEVKAQPLLREIHANGRVAYQPDLFLAQQEYLIALKTSSGERTLQNLQSRLVQSAKLKLRLLGMNETQIQELSRKGKAQTGLLLPQTEGLNWIYGSIFESDLAWVKTGDTVQVFVPGQSESYSSKIESIDPAIDSTTRTAQIRFRLSQSSGFLKPDLFLKLIIQTQTAQVLTIPEEALLDTGRRTTVFLDRGNGKFEPRPVKIGRRGTGFVEIISGVSAGDRVVTSANFLLDAESKLKAGPGEGEPSHD